MSSSEELYITHCSSCQDGRVQFRRCHTCHRIAGLCDGCHLMWADIQEVSHDSNGAADSKYPQCPSCGDQRARWATVSSEEIDENHLRRFCSTDSI